MATDPGEGLCRVASADCADPFGESIGIKREDFLLRWNAGIGVQFSRTVALQLSYEGIERDSNTPEVGFNTDTITLEFRFGWASDREYI